MRVSIFTRNNFGVTKKNTINNVQFEEYSLLKISQGQLHLFQIFEDQSPDTL